MDDYECNLNEAQRWAANVRKDDINMPSSKGDINMPSSSSSEAIREHTRTTQSEITREARIEVGHAAAIAARRAGAPAESQAAADILSKASGHYGKTASDYYQHGATDPNLTWRDIMGMANGGIINEPILGIGKSGQAYAFGERGAETVTPGVGGGGQTNFILNLNVGNIGNNADYSELRDLVQRWVLEANSRRGII